MQFCKSFLLIFMQIDGGEGIDRPFAFLCLLHEACAKLPALFYHTSPPHFARFQRVTTTDGRPRRDAPPSRVTSHRLLPDEALLEDLLVAEPHIGDVG